MDDIVIVVRSPSVLRDSSMPFFLRMRLGLTVIEREHDERSATIQNRIRMPICLPPVRQIGHRPGESVFEPLDEGVPPLGLARQANAHRIKAEPDRLGTELFNKTH